MKFRSKNFPIIVNAHLFSLSRSHTLHRYRSTSKSSKVCHVEDLLCPWNAYSNHAPRGKTGSKVVLCTDGLANVGLGALDPTKVEESNEFYERVGSIAKDLGVTISVITIKGEGCAISVLSKLTGSGVFGSGVSCFPFQCTRQ